MPAVPSMTWITATSRLTSSTCPWRTVPSASVIDHEFVPADAVDTGNHHQRSAQFAHTACSRPSSRRRRVIAVARSARTMMVSPSNRHRGVVGSGYRRGRGSAGRSRSPRSAAPAHLRPPVRGSGRSPPAPRRPAPRSSPMRSSASLGIVHLLQHAPPAAAARPSSTMRSRPGSAVTPTSSVSAARRSDSASRSTTRARRTGQPMSPPATTPAAERFGVAGKRPDHDTAG